MVYVTEELLLLAYDDEKGHDNSFTNLGTGLAGAVMLDLSLTERITMENERVAIADARPLGHPVMDDVLHQIATDSKQRKIGTWLNRISWGLANRVRDALIEQEVLRPQENRALGLFKFQRYLPARPEVEEEVRQRLERVVRIGRIDDAHTAGLVGLIEAIGLTGKALPKMPAAEAKKTLKAISQDWRHTATDATGRAVKAQQEAVQAAILASLVTTMVAGSSG